MKYKKGHLYEFHFLDHATNSKSGPIEAKAAGYFLDECEKSLTIATWLSLDPDPEDAANNNETLTILKSAIIHKWEIL